MPVDCVTDGAFRIEITAGPHSLVVDEAERLGGTDLGPDPFDLVMAALGSCTAIVIVDAARERDLTVGRVRVTVSATATTRPQRPSDPDLAIAELQRTIEIEGDLSPEDRAWLHARGADSPIYRSLTAGVPIRTSVAEPA